MHIDTEWITHAEALQRYHDRGPGRQPLSRSTLRRWERAGLLAYRSTDPANPWAPVLVDARQLAELASTNASTLPRSGKGQNRRG